MSESVSNSFIPKRNPGTKPRQVRTRNVFVLSAISYALFVSAPLASAGIFIYKLQAEKNEAVAIKALDDAIATFSDVDFKRVLAYEERLNKAEFLVDSHVSIGSLVKILGAATAQTVQFKNLEITRTSNTAVAVKADIKTSALDGVLFQRSQYKSTAKIAETDFDKIILAAPKSDDNSNSGSNEVSLSAKFSFSADEITYTPLAVTTTEPPVMPPESTIVSTTTEVVNEDTI